MRSKTTSVRPRLLLLDAGGTIGQVWNEKTETLEYTNYAPFGYLDSAQRGVLERMADIDYRVADSCRGDSSSLGPANWRRIAEMIFRLDANYDGVVIAHGTATLAFAASLLSFMLADLWKPIVLTGAQVPIRGGQDRLASDGFGNLVSSVRIAAEGRVREVVIVFGTLVLRGSRACKVFNDIWDAFRSPNFPPLAVIHSRGISYNQCSPRPVSPALATNRRFSYDDRVLVVAVHPGMRGESLRDSSQQSKALILVGYAHGIVPAGLHEEVTRLAHDRLVVVCAQGRFECWSDSGLLSDEWPLGDAGAVWARDMVTEAACMKACWVLGQEINLGQQRTLMLTSVAGEVTIFGDMDRSA